MTRYTSTPKHVLDQRRYRFRVRFERPPGGGTWAQEKKFFAWLDERLGKDRYIFQGDTWEGHGLDCLALHFDDHSIIPELLTRYAAIYLEAAVSPRFRALLTRDDARAARDAIARLQEYLVDQLNATAPRIVWALGTATVLPGPRLSVGETMHLARIQHLSEIAALLGVVPANDEKLEIILEDYQRGALAVGFAMWRDARPHPAPEFSLPLGAMLEALTEQR